MLALEIEGLSHRFGAKTVLDGVSLAVAEGSLTALLGINGAGKTTLFNLITRLYAAREGRIAVCGQDLAADPLAALAKLGIVFQSRALDPSLTAAQNLRYAAALHGIGAREASRRAAALMERLGIADLAGRPVRTLSGGQAQRAEIARALMHRPRLLLCDEATAGLDIEARRALVAEVHRLAAEDGVGILWATHLTDEIAPEDPVAILHEGRIRAAGTAAEITLGAAGAQNLEAAFLARIRSPAEPAPSAKPAARPA